MGELAKLVGEHLDTGEEDLAQMDTSRLIPLVNLVMALVTTGEEGKKSEKEWRQLAVARVPALASQYNAALVGVEEVERLADAENLILAALACNSNRNTAGGNTGGGNSTGGNTGGGNTGYDPEELVKKLEHVFCEVFHDSPSFIARDMC